MNKHDNQSRFTNFIMSNKKYIYKIIILVFLGIILVYALYRVNMFYSNNPTRVGNVLTTTNLEKDRSASDVVIKYLEAEKNNDIATLESLLWKTYNNQGSDIILKSERDLGVISLFVDKVEISEKETQAIKQRYIGSDLAKSYQWSNDFLEKNLIAVYAKYTVDYDNTKVSYNEGEIAQYFYLLRANEDSLWYIWEQSYDVKY